MNRIRPKLLYKRNLDTIVKSILSHLQRLRVAFLLLKVYQNDQKIKIFRVEFIFETIKMLTLDIKFILHKNNNYV